jgi:hypothetical protein
VAVLKLPARIDGSSKGCGASDAADRDYSESKSYFHGKRPQRASDSSWKVHRMRYHALSCTLNKKLSRPAYMNDAQRDLEHICKGLQHGEADGLTGHRGFFGALWRPREYRSEDRRVDRIIISSKIYRLAPSLLRLHASQGHLRQPESATTGPIEPLLFHCDEQ